MLLKTFFIILAAFLVYYFGFYPDSEKTISGEQTTQNPQLWNAKKINFQISLGDNQYRLQAKKIEALNEEKYSIQRVQLAIADGWSIQAQQAILENKNLELLQKASKNKNKKASLPFLKKLTNNKRIITTTA